MGLPAKSPQAILWGPRKEGEQYSHVKDKTLPEGKEKRGKRGMVTKILPRAGGVSTLFAILSEYAV